MRLKSRQSPGQPFEKEVWRHFVLVADLAEGTASLFLRRTRFHPADGKTTALSIALPTAHISAGFSKLILGADACETEGRQRRIDGAFNGRVASPRLWREKGGNAEIELLLSGVDKSPPRLGRPLASWNFVAQAKSDLVPDESGNGFDAATVNRPTRLVTGPNFSGVEEDPSALPGEFNAAHFHEDDLSDAGWEESFTFIVPSSQKSGVYAMKLTSSLGEDYVPFFVTTEIGEPTSKVAILIPTVSYQVYANGRLDPSILPAEIVPLRSNDGPSPAAVYVDHYGLRSCYDRHTDGTGVCMATTLRPMPITVRPRSKSTFNSSPHQLGADLYITYWLEKKGVPFDVVTDHELDQHGAERLADYNVVLSGTHAEYWTERMLDGLKAYTDNGGRFVYLSGNGLYWVTGLSADGTLAEIRRDQGTRSWSAAPGEAFISLTGKRGGLWRHRGRAPQKYVGVGFASQGFDAGRPYQRTPESYTSRAAIFFEGVDDEIIGDFPAFISAYGAGGYEFDRADTELGTPAHALTLASATGFSDCYQLAVEEVPATAPFYGGSVNPNVRADIVFFETPNGGAVFSTSSIAWCSALSYNDCENNVSRLTENVVRRFMKDGPLQLDDN